MRLLSKYDLFIFDWDHTLTTSTLFVTLLYYLVKRSKHKSTEGMRKKHPSDFSAKNVEIKEEVSKIYSAFDDLYGVVFKPKLKPDAIRLLAMLRKRRKRIAIFSDSKTYRLLKETEYLGVLRYVGKVLSAESIGYYKPDPTGLLLLIDRFHVPKERSLYIGDMAGDVLTAKLAGIDSCAICDGIDSPERLRNEKPDYVFPQLGSFLDAIESGK
ncbi:MAG: HAD hydrolase-like protein [Candidatus Micrarchaeota archaeon]|nr:HAD hydrolase-like protein [Candidatus Micrarchaeota archaeon]